MITVLANGVFDFLHWGHLMHLQQARTFGDVLIVAVTEDEHVNKGPNRPFFKLHQRMEMLRALAIVDKVFQVSCPEDAIQIVKPQVYVKGVEYMGNLKEQALVESFGGRVMFTHHDEGSKIHSRHVIHQYQKNAQKPAGDRKPL